jgi:hypothetical protein
MTKKLTLGLQWIWKPCTKWIMPYILFIFLSKEASVDMWWKEGRNAVIDAQVPNGYYYSLQACHQPTAWFLTHTKDSTFD